MSILHHRMAVIGGKSYNRIPLKMLKAIPAGFPLALHDDMFGAAGHSDAIFSNIQSAGEDLRAFADLNMTSEIPIEILAITTGSNLLKAFVRVPSALSINDKIYLRTTVGGGEAAPAADSTNGSEAVWQDYNIVIHGSDVTADATGNTSVSNTGGVSLSGASLLNGWPAYGFGTVDGIATTDLLTVTTPGDSSGTRSDTYIVYKDAAEDVMSGRLMEYSINAVNAVKDPTNDLVAHRKGSTTSQIYDMDGGEFTSGWFGAQFSFPSFTSAPSGRLNGATPTATATAGVGTLNVGSGDMILMNRPAANRQFTGRLAEFRQRWDTTPDSAWFDLEWDSYNNPGSIAEAESLVIV